MYIIPQLTCTSETSVFSVQTVMVANSIVGAVNKSCLPAVAEQVIQDDGASALAIRGTVKWSCTWKMTRQNIHTPTSATSQTMMYTCDRLCLFFFIFKAIHVSLKWDKYLGLPSDVRVFLTYSNISCDAPLSSLLLKSWVVPGMSTLVTWLHSCTPRSWKSWDFLECTLWYITWLTFVVPVSKVNVHDSRE